MADYIDSNILCQAYVHVEPVNFPEERLELLRKEIEHFVTTRGRFFLYDSVGTSVEFKDGSLKIYASILGALYIAIGQYADFRSGVDYLAQDAKRLAECIASESLFMSQSRRDNTIRVEARIGVAGNLKSIVDSIRQLHVDLAEADAAASARKLEEIGDRIEVLLGNLKDPDDPPFVMQGLCDLINDLLPKTPPPKPKKPHTSEGLAMWREQRTKLVKRLSK